MTHRFSIGSEGAVDLRQTVEVGSLTGDSAVVALESVRLTNLISRDSAREGTIAFDFNGQESIVSWASDTSGRLKNPDKFPGQILFLGEHEGLLELSAAVVESAEDVLRRISRVRSTLGVAASVAGLVPGTGSLLGQGFQLAGAIVGALRKQDQDDVELIFEGSIGAFASEGALLPLRRSGYGIRRNSERGNDILLVFRVMPFEPLREDQEVIVLLDSIDLELRSLRRQLILEASMGMGRRGRPMSFDLPLKNGPTRLDEIMGIQNKVLYRGPWQWGIPFHLNLSTLTQRDSSALKEIVNETGGLVSEALGTAEQRRRAAAVTKAVQSVRSMVLEFLPEKKSIGVRSGHITAPETIADLTTEEKGWFVEMDNLTSWQAFSIELGSKGVGKARLNLRMRQV